MSLHKFADMVASKGRGDDSLLIHMTPDEVQRLQQFAQANGRSLTINPDTGLPEAGMLSDLFKAVAPIALGAFLGPAGAALGGGFLTAAQAGLAVGGITSLATGSLSRGLMAGLGAYGGAGLADSFMNAGTGAGLSEALAGSSSGNLGQAFGDVAASQGSSGQAFNDFLTSSANPAIMSGADMASAGFKAAAADPMAFAKQNFGNIAAAAAPIMAGAMVPTTTKMPENTNPAYIRQKLYDPYTQTYRSLAPVKASEFGSRSFSDAYTNPQTGGIASLDQRQTTPMATGGIVALADGGDAAFEAYQAGEYEKARALLGEAGMSAQDVVSKYGLSQADAATVAQNLGYTGDMSGLQYAPPAVASVPVTMQDNTAQTAMADTVADVGADTTQQKQEWTGGQPTLKQWFDKLGIVSGTGHHNEDLYTAANLYSVVGSSLDPYRQTDTRDWALVMNSDNPWEALIQQNLPLYGGPGRIEGTGRGSRIVSGAGDNLTSGIGRFEEFGVKLEPAQLKNMLDNMPLDTPAERKRYNRINGLYQQALADQSGTTGLATLANAAGTTTAAAAKAGDTTGVASLAANTAAASAPSYTSYSDAQVAKWFTDNPTATNAQVQKAITDSKIDPAAVNRYIAGLTSGFKGSTETTGGSGTLGIFNQMKAQGITPDEYYAAAIANDPKYAGWSKADIQRGYNLDKGAYALSAAEKDGVSDKEWVNFMDTNKYSVNDMAQAFGLSLKEVRDRYNAVKAAEKKVVTVKNPITGEVTSAGPTTTTVLPTTPRTNAPAGTSNPYGNVNNPGDLTFNNDGTITVQPNIPGRPYGGFSGMDEVKNAYTAGGGSTGYVPKVPKTPAEHAVAYNRMTGDSQAAYKYLMGQGANPVQSVAASTSTGIMRPYFSEGMRYKPKFLSYDKEGNTVSSSTNPNAPKSGDAKAAELTKAKTIDIVDDSGNSREIYTAVLQEDGTYLAGNGKRYDVTGKQIAAGGGMMGYASGGITGDGNLNLSIPLDIGGGGRGGELGGGGGYGGYGGVDGGLGKPAGMPSGGSDLYSPQFMPQQGPRGFNQGPRTEADWKNFSSMALYAPGTDMEKAKADFLAGGQGNQNSVQQPSMTSKSPGLQQRYTQQGMQNQPIFANGGMTGYAVGGGLGSLGSYSDGGRLLRGPGDGVSDSIPATIGRKQQPARLADGEFVVPARIVSELGNGSTEAGAKKLYAMMDRVQRARGKTTGKNKVAANSRADKYLPA